MDLLRDVPTAGFPTDYVVARIRGRRARLVADWHALLVRGLPADLGDERIWGGLLAELEWLYLQMNPRMRGWLGPVLALFELKTVVLCLRNKAAQRSSEIPRLLEHSLLAEAIRQALLQPADVRPALAALAAAIGAGAGELRTLEVAYASDGLRGVENCLMRDFLERIVTTRLHAVVRTFVIALIDLRNLMILYKQLRWQVDDGAAYIAGGSIAPATLREAAARKEPAGLATLAATATGLPAADITASAGALETLLLRSLAERLRLAGRDSEDVGVVLDYAWRIYLEARNLAVLHHAGELGASAIEPELVT